jgi:hypothetical protein
MLRDRKAIQPSKTEATAKSGLGFFVKVPSILPYYTNSMLKTIPLHAEETVFFNEEKEG